MDIFDSHSHLDDHGFDQDRDEVVRRAHAAGVKAMMVVGVDAQSSKRAVAIANQYEGLMASVGVHPHDAKSCTEEILNDLRVLSKNPNVRAWGETGLDYNRMHSPRKDQEHWFIRQLEMGSELQLPMIFHERESQGRFLKILQKHWNPRRSGVVHCFSGADTELQAYLELGLFIGVTGILTIKSRGADLRRMVRDIPADRLLVETDAPYLTPTPERNKYRRNEPAFVRTVLLKLAAERQEDPYAFAAEVYGNSCRLFGETIDG